MSGLCDGQGGAETGRKVGQGGMEACCAVSFREKHSEKGPAHPRALRQEMARPVQELRRPEWLGPREEGREAHDGTRRPAGVEANRVWDFTLSMRGNLTG